MKLWLLRPVDGLPDHDNPWQPWYDKAFGFVIRAASVKDARRLAHENAGDENLDVFWRKKTADTNAPWIDPKYSTCIELTQDGGVEVVVKAFCGA